MILAPLQKLPKNGEDLGKFIVAKGFERLPKVQNIAQSGHTGSLPISIPASTRGSFSFCNLFISLFFFLSSLFLLVQLLFPLFIFFVA